jgi:hypothetical protein
MVFWIPGCLESQRIFRTPGFRDPIIVVSGPPESERFCDPEHELPSR